MARRETSDLLWALSWGHMEAAFFDLDKTVIARSSSLAFGKNFYREGLITKRLLARAVVAQFVYLLVGADEAKMEKMRKKAQTLTIGWDQTRIRRIIEDVMGDVITPIIFKEAADLIDLHRADGRKVVIVSSAPEEIVAPLGELLGADEVIASRAEVDPDGRYTGEIEFYCYGPHKATAIREFAQRQGIDLAASFAYSDSITDLPMLEVVGHPVAVNPDRALARTAEERGWDVLRFNNPVTVRKRLAEIAPSGRTVALSGGGALTLVAVGLGYAWLRRRSRPN